MFKVNNKDTKQCQWCCFGVFIVNFEHILHLGCSVSIVNFEHVIAGWVTHVFQRCCKEKDRVKDMISFFFFNFMQCLNYFYCYKVFKMHVTLKIINKSKINQLLLILINQLLIPKRLSLENQMLPFHCCRASVCWWGQNWV